MLKAASQRNHSGPVAHQALFQSPFHHILVIDLGQFLRCERVGSEEARDAGVESNGRGAGTEVGKEEADVVGVVDLGDVVVGDFDVAS